MKRCASSSAALGPANIAANANKTVASNAERPRFIERFPGMAIRVALDRDLRGNRRMRIVGLERDVGVAEGEEILDRGIEFQRGQAPWLPRELQPRLFEMREIKMRVAERVHEFAGHETRDLRDHLGQERVGGDVERHAEEHVARALIELAGEPPIAHPELEQAMAGRERHLGKIGRVPGAHDQPPRTRIGADFGNHFFDLVDGVAVLRRPRTPLLAVDGPKLAVGVGPFVPDRHPVLAQIFDVGVAGEKPQQFVHDRLQMQLLGRSERKALGEVEAQLVAEHRKRAGAGTVVFFDAVLEDAFEEIEIRAHGLYIGCDSKRAAFYARANQSRKPPPEKKSAPDCAVAGAFLVFDDTQGDSHDGVREADGEPAQGRYGKQYHALHFEPQLGPCRACRRLERRYTFRVPRRAPWLANQSAFASQSTALASSLLYSVSSMTCNWAQ